MQALHGRRKGRKRRRGAAMVEAAIVISVFLTLALGLMDLAIALFDQQMISEAARQLARQAIVHGNTPTNLLPQWGPGTYSGTANAGDAIATAVQPFLTGLDPSKVNLQVVWLNNDNKVESPVQVTVTTSWTPMITYLFGGVSRTLKAESTMPIAH